MKKISNAWIFDVDGVLTNPETKTASSETIEALSKRLKNQEVVALISGRAMNWIEERIAKKVIAALENPSLLDNLIISAEFGGSKSWYENGHRNFSIDGIMRLTHELVESAEKIAQEYSDVLFVDQGKETMISLEMKDGIELDEFKSRQSELDRELEDLVKNLRVSDEIEVHKDTIATNIRHKKSNKRHATQVVIDWINSRQISPEMYIAFGDSVSDIEIKDELDSQNLPNKFVFVGEKSALEETTDENIIFTNEKYDLGTLEFLEDYKA